MPRKPRAEVGSGVYHVFARANNREPLYIDDGDRELYLDLLGKVTVKARWQTMAYCLMSTHVHLLVETRGPTLSVGMQHLHGAYARMFNGRHRRRGHLFERRFRAVPITTDAQLQVTAAYIALNPVDAGLCEEPEQWVWSSHAAALGNETRPPWLDLPRLHGYFGAAGGEPVRRYAHLVRERREARAAHRPGLVSSDWDDAQFATPEGDWDRIHSRSVSSPTRA